MSVPLAYYCVLVILSHPVLSYSNDGIHERNEELKTFNPSKLPRLFENAMEEMFANLFSYNDGSDSCLNDWVSLANLTQNVKVFGSFGRPTSELAISIDAFGKPQDGFLRGNVRYMGNYDECLSINTKSLDFSMQYCQIGVRFNISSGKVPKLPIQFTEAVCVPTSCSLEDFESIINFLNKTSILQKHNVTVDIPPNSFICTSQEGLKFSTGSIIMIIVSFSFLSFTILATVIDIIMYIYFWSQCEKSYIAINDDTFDYAKTPNSDEYISLLGHSKRTNRYIVFMFDILKGFSLYKTVPAVFSTKQPPTAITSINGMRVISMFWVIMCHTFAFSYISQGFSNPYDLTSSFVSRFSAQPIMNGFFSVDSFFFLSGLLVAYLTFRNMKRNKGRFPYVVYYVHRILRLTPTYMFVLFFYWLVTVHMGNGPNLLFGIGPDSIAAKSCESYWWTNLLYINNFYPTMAKNCMGWAWYLANDMQFYVVSPLLLIPLFYWFPAGLIALCTLLITSFGITGLIAGYYDFPANQFLTAPMTNSDLPNQMDQIYVKPYCRIAPYLVGIFLGYLLYKKFRIPVTNLIKGWLVHLLLWLVALVLGLVNVYGLYPSWHGHKLTTAENVSYFMFSRFTWGVTLALVVFLCHTGYGGIINRFLSLPIWIPLSRLTFNVYLVHEMIMVLLFSEMRDTLYYTDTVMMIYTVSIVVVSYGAAGVVSVFVEYPLSNLESAVFKLIGVPLQSSTRRSEDGVANSRDATSALETAVRIS